MSEQIVETANGPVTLEDDENGHYKITNAERNVILQGKYSGAGPYTAERGEAILVDIAVLIVDLFEYIAEGVE